mmetsp:Transcript_62761/g.181959  ORF Transcript_62761/g.181959 Transcript_62761/m.181959 type:complete len:204 (+) Transcript_62761:81-692(+)
MRHHGREPHGRSPLGVFGGSQTVNIWAVPALVATTCVAATLQGCQESIDIQCNDNCEVVVRCSSTTYEMDVRCEPAMSAGWNRQDRQTVKCHDSLMGLKLDQERLCANILLHNAKRNPVGFLPGLPGMHSTNALQSSNALGASEGFHASNASEASDAASASETNTSKHPGAAPEHEASHDDGKLAFPSKRGEIEQSLLAVITR